MKIPNLYSPIIIRGKKIRNRIILAPMGTRSSLLDGTLSNMATTYLEERARGGAGIIITELTSVREGYSWIPSLQIYSDKLIPALSKLADNLHCYNSLILMQLALHGGRAASKVTNKPCIAPSAIKTCLYNEIPVALNEEEIYKLIEDWTKAAIRVKKAGFDGVEVHGSHGYLINQFISPYTNKRTDKWGGNLKNRLRFAEYIINNIRKSCGDKFIIGFKFSAYEHLENGILPNEAVEAAKYIEEKTSIDYLHVAATSSSVPGHSYCKYPSVPSMYDSSNILSELAEMIKKEVDLPVIAAAGISDPEDAEKIIKNGQADMVAIGRAFLADAHWGLKAQANKNIKPCIRCNVCHKNILLGKNVICAINPGLLREYRDLNVSKVKNIQKLLIIGSGPSGLETAIQAVEKGNKVVIYEKSQYIGGALRLAAIPCFKYRVKKLMNYYLTEIKEKEINVITSFEINESNILEVIKKEEPDFIILATGGKPSIPKIEGIQRKNIHLAEDFLNEPEKHILGNKIVVLGGGKVGLETAWCLADLGKEVSVVEMMEDDKILFKDHPTTRASLLHNIKKRDIKIISGCKVKKIHDNKLDLEFSNGKKDIMYMDTLIIATGFIPDNELQNILYDIDYRRKTFLIGDGKEVRGLKDSIHEGYFLGKYII